ncbi:MAG: DUF1080 domain-containing protein [Prevotellaceae bacterium]|jgi:hypothetical protein|nr:DUF1080 domain-containing protein [Prevotellaceae bacterium]
MKKIILGLGCIAIAAVIAACGGSVKTTPEYTVIEKQVVDLATFPINEEGYTVLFDGESFNGWRGYGKDNVPGKWIIEDGCIKFNGSGGGEAQETDGGDLIFAHKFKNFELKLEWKISKGGNSGILYLAQEIETKDKDGNPQIEPIYISAPEFQLLDNEGHPDAKLGKDNNRQAASLYDMIPANPQNANPAGEWNEATVMVYQGTVVHGQNGLNVVEYHLWTPQWTAMLQASKFSEKAWPLAYELLNNCGGPNREGYFGLQDHGNDIWFRNIRIKLLD